MTVGCVLSTCLYVVKDSAFLSTLLVCPGRVGWEMLGLGNVVISPDLCYAITRRRGTSDTGFHL